ncbi:hypothetical protein ACI6QG_05415 [Roseococcus sp. DSY-14]|uniref:hypothetical protein n=1 Tax=Roseococcus sp. DSY-14 TaxID=3369650 RepID=UPI00387B95FB
MIIAATRIRSSSGARPVLDHVLRGDGNDAVTIIRGTEADVHEMAATARHAVATYAVRHFIIAPAKELNDADAADILQDLGNEFGFDPDAVLLVRHDKGRAATRSAHQTGAALPPASERPDVHWHALVGEVDPVTLRVLGSRNWRARHEKVSRLAELRLGQPVVQGRWNRAVLDHLDRGDAVQRRLADRLVHAGLRERAKPRAAYSRDQRRRLERLQHDHLSQPLDLPLLVHQLGKVWDDHGLRNGQDLQDRLRHRGLRIATEEMTGPGDHAPPRSRVVVEGWDKAARQLYVLGTLHCFLREALPKVQARLRALALDPPTAGILPNRTADAPSAPTPPPAPPKSITRCGDGPACPRT